MKSYYVAEQRLSKFPQYLEFCFYRYSFYYQIFEQLNKISISLFHLIVFFFYLDFLSQPFTNHKTAGEGGGYLFNSSLPFPPASQALRHQPGDYCRELTSAHRQQLVSNREPLVSERKSLTTKLRVLSFYIIFQKNTHPSILQYLFVQTLLMSQACYLLFFQKNFCFNFIQFAVLRSKIFVFLYASFLFYYRNQVENQ